MKRIKFIDNWLLKKRINQAITLLKKIDDLMKTLNMPRWKRKQIWRDFIKSEDQRMNIMQLLNGGKP